MKFILFIFLELFTILCNSQNTTSLKLLESNDFDNKILSINGKNYGCLSFLECNRFVVAFFFASIDTISSEVFIKGRTISSISENAKDTMPLYDIWIVYAKEENGKLRNVIPLGFSKNRAKKTEPLSKIGLFSIRFKKKEKFNLYFLYPRIPYYAVVKYTL